MKPRALPVDSPLDYAFPITSSLTFKRRAPRLLREIPTNHPCNNSSSAGMGAAEHAALAPKVQRFVRTIYAPVAQRLGL
ncbi:MAG TPA: hypothetical protein VFN67_33465 [Polyangiales bacterium]|nr:hypothetical protein [Polyangiales bacterium]